MFQKFCLPLVMVFVKPIHTLLLHFFCHGEFTQGDSRCYQKWRKRKSTDSTGQTAVGERRSGKRCQGFGFLHLGVQFNKTKSQRMNSLGFCFVWLLQPNVVVFIFILIANADS